MHYMQRAVATTWALLNNSPLLLLLTAAAALADRAQHSAETLCTLCTLPPDAHIRQETDPTLMAIGVFCSRLLVRLAECRPLANVSAHLSGTYNNQLSILLGARLPQLHCTS
jgi:hypothetical protein